MTQEEKISTFCTMLGDEEEDVLVITTYLDMAKQKILNHRFPFGTTLVDVEPQYEYDQIELAIVLYNQRGVEGQSKHSENSISRSWRTVGEILSGIPRKGGIPK